MRKLKLLEIDLRLFDGAAAGAAAGGEGAAGEGASQGSQGTLPKAETNRRPGSSRRARSGEYDNVVFGKQGDASAAADTGSDAGSSKGEGNANKSGVTTTSDTLEAKRKAFKAMIEGEYKEQYTEEFNNYFNRRFKDAKTMEQSLSAQKPIIDMLMQKYKIGDGDVGKLQSAIEQDSTYWEAAAEEAGLTVEQYKAMQKMERDSAELQALKRKQQGEKQAQEQLARWYRDAEQVKELYPSFDFRTEAANRDFMGLLKSGIPVQKAYELVHMEEIKEAAARNAAQAAGQQVVAKIKSKAARPSENGTSSQSAVTIKSDVHNLTRKDRAEVVRRVQRGEKITF